MVLVNCNNPRSLRFNHSTNQVTVRNVMYSLQFAFACVKLACIVPKVGLVLCSILTPVGLEVWSLLDAVHLFGGAVQLVWLFGVNAQRLMSCIYSKSYSMLCFYGLC